MPPDYAAEMVPFDPLVGEFRVHYAGFFDPGFGYAGAGGRGARAVLEVRSREVPFILEHGQIVGRLIYEKMAARPRSCTARASARITRRRASSCRSTFGFELGRPAGRRVRPAHRHHCSWDWSAAAAPPASDRPKAGAGPAPRSCSGIDTRAGCTAARAPRDDLKSTFHSTAEYSSRTVASIAELVNFWRRIPGRSAVDTG